jgi:GPH family glycoside/pentoside/hexuronide:cation symporter
LILSIIDFKSGAPTQTYETMFELRLFFSAIPMIGTLIAIWVMYDYDVNEEKAREISAELAKRKATVKNQSSVYHSGKLLSLIKRENINTLVGRDLNVLSQDDLKLEFSKTLHDGMHGLCFSPYQEGQNIGDILTAEQISRRMLVISPYTNWIRSFSCTDGNELIPKIAYQNGLKTVVGAWISNDKAKNEREIEALIKLGKSGLVTIAAVGNEVLHRGESSEKELISYIQRVKDALPDIPVAYVDAYYQFLDKPNLISNCDLLLVNFYPFWEGAPIDYAAAYLQNMLELTQTVANGKKIVVTETGWPSKGDAVGHSIPSEVNAMKYFISTQEWANNTNIELFHFSSFDESWKESQEGTIGTSWGIWDENEELKFKAEQNVI